MSKAKPTVEFSTLPSKVTVVVGKDRVTFVPEGTWVEAMGVTGAARELGCTPSNIDAIVGLPEPVQRLERGRLWRAEDIRALAKRRAKS